MAKKAIVVATKIKSCMACFSGLYLPRPFAVRRANGFQFVHVEGTRPLSLASNCFSQPQNQHALSALLPFIAPKREPKIDQECYAGRGDGRNN
jgi:hypothetical protein